MLTHPPGCADCFLEHHPQHQRITTQAFFQLLKDKINDMKAFEAQLQDDSAEKLLQMVDHEFEYCSSNIVARFNAIKVDLKAMIDGELHDHQLDYDAIRNDYAAYTAPIRSLLQKPLHTLSLPDLQLLSDFHTNGHNKLQKFQHAQALLAEQRNKVELKKQKYLRKLSTVVQTLLKEFKASMDEEQVFDANQITPPKKILKYCTYQKTISSPVKQPLQVIEMSRSRRKLPTQDKKLFFNQKKLKID